MSLSEFHSDFPLLCRCLEQTKLQQRTGQAYLLVGDDNQYLYAFAKAWAQTAACLNCTPSGAACGQCRPCQLFQSNSYNDCLEIAPQSKSRIITIEAIRNFDHQLSLKTRPDRLKIGLLRDAECLGPDAQNAFLKTLEEPPPHTMLLLLTTNARQLLPTIRSRCQTLLLLRNRRTYSPVITAELLPVLARMQRRAGVKIALEASASISNIFSRLHEEAEKLIADTWDPRWENAAADNKKLLKELNELRQVKIESEYIRLREEFIDAMQSWFQQRYLIACGVTPELLPQPEFLPCAEPLLAKPPSPEEADQDVKHLAEFAKCLKANVEESLALDSLCLSICEKTPTAGT